MEQESIIAIEESEDLYGVLYPYVRDEKITDIDYNGKDVWVRDCNNYKRKIDVEITDAWVAQFTQRISNYVSKELNVQNPRLEAETPKLRLSIIHESAAVTGRSICIRKTPPYVRISVGDALKSGYADAKCLSLLYHCIKAHQVIMIGGEPGAGKTELAKFLSQFIPAEERVITIEDSLEWHYQDIRPDADCVSLQTGKYFTIDDAITACLRQNPKWLNVSELRGAEVQPYMKNISGGMKGITTIHVDDVRNISDRMCNMCDSPAARDRMETDVYSYLNVGVLVSQKQDPDNPERKVRFIDQVAFFYRMGDRKYVHMVYDNGLLVTEQLPEKVLYHMKRENIGDVWNTDEIQKRSQMSAGEFYQYVPTVGTETSFFEKQQHASIDPVVADIMRTSWKEETE